MPHPNSHDKVFSMLLDLIHRARRNGPVAASVQTGVPVRELRDFVRFKATYGTGALRHVYLQPNNTRRSDGRPRWSRPDNLEGMGSALMDGSPPDGRDCGWDWETSQFQVGPFQGAPEPEPIPIEGDGLLEDIALLNKVVNDPEVPASVRETAAKWRDFFIRENARIETASALAESMGIRSQFEPLSNADLAKWISEALVKDGKDGPFSFLYSLAPVYCEYYPLPDFIFDSFRQTLLELFTVGLVNEFGRRCAQHEDKDGRSVSDLVAEVYNRDQILLHLGTRAAKGLWCRGEEPGRSAETPSMAQLFIWKSLAGMLPKEILNGSKIPVTEPKFLE